MAKKKAPTDPNVIAHEILQAITGEPSGTTSVKKATKEKPAKKAQPAKNPAAVALGRLGGLKGGKARMAKLSPKRRADIARKAAKARWKAEK